MGTQVIDRVQLIKRFAEPTIRVRYFKYRSAEELSSKRPSTFLKQKCFVCIFVSYLDLIKSYFCRRQEQPNCFFINANLKTKPQISDQTFWDIDVETLSFEDAFDWVILRVFDKGSLQEVMSVVNYYGSEKAKSFLQNEESYLPNHTILLAKAIFQLNFSDFKCLEKKPFQQRFPMC